MGRPQVISLYTGAGGLDFGFEAAGFDTAVAIEMDHDCCETLRANRRWRVIERDILQVPSDEILRVAGLKKGEASLLVGGPPCQPFSKAGYWARGDSLRLGDPRAATLAAYLRVLEETLPDAFLLENVEGLAYQGKDEGLQLLLDALDGINRRTKSRYRPHVQIMNAADYGVPQLRNRVLLVAARDGSEFNLPPPTHVEELAAGDPRPRYRTAWDAIGDVEPEPDEDLALRGRWADLLPSIPEGQNYLWHTDRGGGKELFGWRRRYWSFLLKLAKDKPSWTIQAQPGPAIGPFHWKSRKLSMRELCRLQTFPDDVRILGNRNNVQKQVGNAVPSLMAEVVGRAIRTQLLGLPALKGELTLLPPVRTPVPPAEKLRPVHRKYHDQIGKHSAHPGTGKGNAATIRQQLPAME
jgi:DNA (cytosine-5)-methyltransferase 1